MGGSGSGSWYRWDSKITTESQRRIDIRWLRRNGYLGANCYGSLTWSRGSEQTGSIGFRMESDRMILNYRHRQNGAEWSEVEQVISFGQTQCNYGGYRTWFICPRCYRRIAVLYGTGKYFYCRHCYGLTYSSQQENHPNRLMRKSNKIQKRLGGDENLMDSFPEKPKNMHWKTYWRLREEAVNATNLAFMSIGQRFGVHF
jgi:hypothetical protein